MKTPSCIGGGYRYIFENPRKQKHIDVFFDQLEMCHTVLFKDRLDIDSCTISLADLLLEKMQIVEISRKDLRIRPSSCWNTKSGRMISKINMEYIGRIMSND